MADRPAYVGSALATLKQSERLLKDHEDQAAAAMATTALTLATLALVKQQQIANLIALSQATHANGARVYWRAIVIPAGIDSAVVKPEILSALGLSDE